MENQQFQTENRFSEFTPEELSAYIEEKASLYDSKLESNLTNEDITGIMEYVKALIAKGSTLKAAKTMAAIKPLITEAAHAENALPENQEQFAHYALLAVRFIPPSKEEFADFGVLHDAISAFELSGNHDNFLCFSLKYALLNYYEEWLKNGGNTERQSEEEQGYLTQLANEFESELLKTSASITHAEQSISFRKLLYRYYVKNQKPNEAIRELKGLAEHLPLTADYHVSELAEVYFDMGQIFLKHKKHDVAKSYFEKSLNIYEEAGEDFEMFAAQTESWIETCEKEMKG